MQPRKRPAPAPAPEPEAEAAPGPMVRSDEVDLDDRKLTKAQRSNLAATWERNRGRALSGYMDSIQTVCQQKFGAKEVMLGDQLNSLLIVIPCPSLGFEYLIANDGFPLGVIIQVVSQAGIGKSALLAEFMRWVDDYGGAMFLKEAEDKFNPAWYESILRDRFNCMHYQSCASVEAWQRAMSFTVTTAKKLLLGTKEQPGPGPTIPHLLGVDSIMGRPSEETQDKITSTKKEKGSGTAGDGAAGRNFPIEALKISTYLKTAARWIARWPFTIVLVNHLKIGQDDAGNPERRKGGGKTVDFQESFEIELKKLGGHKKMIRTKEFEGYPIELSCEKNSFGPGHRKIRTRLLWTYERDTFGDPIQRTWWDWDWTTVDVLQRILDGGDSPMLRESLRSSGFHLECPSVAEIENLAWSKNLGMTKDDAAPWSEVGRMIRESPELSDYLRQALFIKHRSRLKGNYWAQKQALAEELP